MIHQFSINILQNRTAIANQLYILYCLWHTLLWSIPLGCYEISGNSHYLSVFILLSSLFFYKKIFNPLELFMPRKKLLKIILNFKNKKSSEWIFLLTTLTIVDHFNFTMLVYRIHAYIRYEHTFVFLSREHTFLL